MEIESCLKQVAASKVVGTPFWDNSGSPSGAQVVGSAFQYNCLVSKLELNSLANFFLLNNGLNP
jgi:hypothetical protein